MRALTPCFLPALVGVAVFTACVGEDPDVAPSTTADAGSDGSAADVAATVDAGVDVAPACTYQNRVSDGLTVYCPKSVPACPTRCCIGDTNGCVEDGGACPNDQRTHECESPNRCGTDPFSKRRRACCAAVALDPTTAAQECPPFVTYADFAGTKCSSDEVCPSGSFIVCLNDDDCAKGHCHAINVEMPPSDRLLFGVCL